MLASSLSFSTNEMDRTPRQPRVDRVSRDEKAMSVFPPVKLKVTSAAAKQVPAGRVQKVIKPPRSSSAIKQLQLSNTASSENKDQTERRVEKVHFCDPWTSYEKRVYYDDGCDVIGVLSTSKRRVARTIVRVAPALRNEQIHELLDIRNKHIVLLHEVFQDTDTFLVYDSLHISLEVLIGCGENFTEPQMARVCHEVSTAPNIVARS
jgi:hypothetical protein